MKTISIDGYSYALPFRVNVEIGDLEDGRGDVFGFGSVSNEELVTVAAALNEYNPWCYPAKGELPERDNFYVVTCGKSAIEICYWCEGKWHGKAWEESDVRAWRELPEPAPELAATTKYKRDEWSLDDGVRVGVESIRVACDPQGDWSITYAEFENGDDATGSELEQLRDMNPEKFAELIHETIEAEAEAMALD